MKDIHMGTAEMQFADLVWQNQPINSTALVNLAGEVMNWQKSTSYTVLKRLCAKGVLKNENAMVTSLVSKEEAQESRLTEMVEETFEGSIPAFIAAFSRSKKLSKADVDQLQALIDSFGK